MSTVIQLLANEHPIKSVTVFKSLKAEIVRSFTVDLAEGQNKINIKGLSKSLDRDTTRITGLGDDARLNDIVCHIPYNIFGQVLSPATTRDHPLQINNTQKHQLELEKQLKQHQIDMLLAYAKTLSGEHITPNTMTDFSRSFFTETRRHLGDIATLDDKIAALEEENQALLAGHIDTNTRTSGQANANVVAIIFATRHHSITFNLTYIVQNLSWTPIYELHASITPSTGQASTAVSLHYRAKVTQSTGEDWTKASLTLSTVEPNTNTQDIPQLKMEKIRIISSSSFNRFGSKESQTSGGFQSQMNMPPSGTAKPVVFGQPAQSSATFVPAQSLGSKQAQQQTQANSTFGSQAQFQPANGAGLFGQTAPTSGFGNGNTVTSASGGIFGQGPPSSLLGASSSITTSGGLFGQPPNTTSSNSAFGSSNFFGSDVPVAPPFGSNNNGNPFFAPTNAVPSSLFGSSGVTNAVAVTSEDDNTDDAFIEISPEEGDSNLPRTVVTESPLFSSYTIDGLCTVPSDGVPHHVTIAVIPFEAETTHICSKGDANAYLQCKVKNTSEYRLLPGLVSVFLDSSYASRTTISTAVAPSSHFICNLGTDPAVRIAHTRTHVTVKGIAHVFGDQSKTTTVKRTTTIHNTHRYPISGLQIRDIVPLSPEHDDRVKVILRKPVGLATSSTNTEGKILGVGEGVKVRWAPGDGEKEGRYLWSVDIGVGKKVVVESEWDVKCPSDVYWQEGH